MKISILFKFNRNILLNYIYNDGVSLGICLSFMTTKSVGKTVKSVKKMKNLVES
jgi:hypothetical protein